MNCEQSIRDLTALHANVVVFSRIVILQNIHTLGHLTAPSAWMAEQIVPHGTPFRAVETCWRMRLLGVPHVDLARSA